jgi:hypothetical protein
LSFLVGLLLPETAGQFIQEINGNIPSMSAGDSLELGKQLQ